jgi:DNA replication and repair protein RecF
MQIQKIRLNDFRNFRAKLLEFSPTTTIILGANASGKSNILESLFLLATGKSFRARVEEEMVNYKKDLARVKGRIKTDGEIVDLEAVLTRGLIDIGKSHPERVPRKRLLVNGLSKRLVDFAGNFKTVLFGPWDLELVTESPSHRRDFLDAVLSQVDREYRRSILSYEKGLRQRNRLLIRIREEGLSRSQLLFWNRLLIRDGDYISSVREEFINYVNKQEGLKGNKFNLIYDKSAISEGRLEQYAEEEIAAATTLVGPHRDDFQFQVIEPHRNRNLDRFGSRGEQRMGVLWLKLAELAFVEEKTGERPTLLLDDIFSELDHGHRKIVIDIVKRHQTPLRPSRRQGYGRQEGFAGQAIITTADPHYVEGLKRVEKIKLEG